MNTSERFAIRRDAGWRPLLALYGGIASQSYVEFDAETLHVRFGAIFDKHFANAEIESVSRADWPWYLGFGWRSNFVGRIGLVGSPSGIVDITLKRKRWVWCVLLPLPCKRLTVSLDDPDGFVTALRSHLNQ